MIARGQSINVTLIFSIERHREVMEAYIRGIERLIEAGGDPRTVASVASYFVSRVDTEADKRLEASPRAAGQARGRERQARLPGWKEIFGGERWAALEAQGATEAVVPLGVDLDQEPGLPRRAVRRGPDRPRHREHDAAGDDRGLPGPRRGRASRSRRASTRLGRLFEDIEAAGVSIDDVTRVLEEEGVQKFSDSFAELLDGITREARRAGLRLIEPGELVERIWERDPTVWTGHDEAQLARLARRAAARCASASAS